MSGGNRVRMAWRLEGFREVRESPGVLSEIDRLAGGIAQRAGEGFEATPAAPSGGRGRGRAVVMAVTHEARKREALEHPLLGALS